MLKPKFEKPPIYISKSGLAYVKAKDILMCEKGQEEILKMHMMLKRLSPVTPHKLDQTG
jgi:hypothetical protein